MFDPNLVQNDFFTNLEGVCFCSASNNVKVPFIQKKVGWVNTSRPVFWGLPEGSLALGRLD